MSMPSSWRKAIVSRRPGAAPRRAPRCPAAQPARAAGRPGRAAPAATSPDRERQHAPAGRGLLARARSPSGPSSVEVLGRPHARRCGRRSACRSSAGARRTARCPRPARRSPGTKAATASSVDVLPGRAGREAPERDRELPLVDPRGRHELDHPQGLLGERAGLVEADHVGRGERLDGVELLAEGAAARHPQRRDRVGQPDQQHEALGDDRDHAGHGRRHRLAERRVLLDQRPAEQQRRAAPSRCRGSARAGRGPARAASAGGGTRAPRPPGAPRRCPAPTASATYAPVPSTAYDPARTGSPAAARHRLRLAGQDRLVHAERRRRARACRRPRPGRRRPPRTRSPGTTSATATCTGRPSRTTVARGATSAARRSRLALARASWMIPMPGVQHQDPEEDGVPPVAEDQRDDAEDQQRHVEDRQQVRPQDARPRAARGGRLHLAPRGQAPLGLALGEALRGGRHALRWWRSGSASASATVGLTTLPSRTLTPGAQPRMRAQRARHAHVGEPRDVGQRRVAERARGGDRHRAGHVRHAVVDAPRPRCRRDRSGSSAGSSRSTRPGQRPRRRSPTPGASVPSAARLTRRGARAPGSSTAPTTRSAVGRSSSIASWVEWSSVDAPAEHQLELAQPVEVGVEHRHVGLHADRDHRGVGADDARRRSPPPSPARPRPRRRAAPRARRARAPGTAPRPAPPGARRSRSSAPAAAAGRSPSSTVS